MPHVIDRDEDGDSYYSEPTAEEGPAWNLEGDPAEMNQKTLCAAVARDVLGCRVKWWPYYCDWCCACPHTEHGCDSQCSSIATPDQLYDRVVEACTSKSIALLAEPAESLLRSALTEWRARRRK